MFAECIHSAADTINQLILAYGIHKSTQTADSDHPYGYANMKYVSSLISGVGIFCVGAGLSFYHGFIGLMHPEPIQDYTWAFACLAGSFLSEGATLLVATSAIRNSAKAAKMSFGRYGEFRRYKESYLIHYFMSTTIPLENYFSLAYSIIQTAH